MRRLSLCLGVAALAAAALVSVAAADGAGGPLFTLYGGTGVASHDGKLHYVTVPDGTRGTLVETIGRDVGGVSGWTRLKGSWGIPAVGPVGQGLSRDGRTLVLAANAGPYASPSRFLVLNLPRMTIRERVTLAGSFSFDALSPDGSHLYLIQYVAGPGDLQDYIVRAYDLQRQRLLPGKIVDRKDDEKTMAGSPLTRVTSADGRWVYTLYRKPSGEPFVHALDTVTATAHCIDLPSVSARTGFPNATLSLRNHDSTLTVARSGRPWRDIAVGTWRVSRPGRAGLPWAWLGAGIAGGLALSVATVLLLRRRRSEERQEHARQELGLA